MKTIIAGSRNVRDARIVPEAVAAFGLSISEVLNGCAPGADTLGAAWAARQGLPVRDFPARWSDVKGKNPKHIRHNRYGAYYLKAGYERNQRMADEAEALLLLWDGVSRGSADMLERAKRAGLKVRVFITP